MENPFLGFELMRDRALRLVDERYKLAPLAAKVPLASITPTVPPGLSFSSSHEFGEMWEGLATGAATFITHLGLMTGAEALDAILSFLARHPEFRDPPEPPPPTIRATAGAGPTLPAARGIPLDDLRQRATEELRVGLQGCIWVVDAPPERLLRYSTLAGQSRDQILWTWLGGATSCASFAVAIGLLEPQDIAVIRSWLIETRPHFEGPWDAVSEFIQLWLTRLDNSQ